MRIIFVSKRYSRPKTLELSRPLIAGLSLLTLGGLALVGKAFLLNLPSSNPQAVLIAEWRGVIADQQQEIISARNISAAKIEALAIKTAHLQSRLLRLDALAERMASMAKLDKSEFDFSDQPAMGGPESLTTEGVVRSEMGGAGIGEGIGAEPEFHKTLDLLADQIDRREQQLEYMESLLSNRELRDAGMLAGRPIVKGWMSSRYGFRTDPFNGRKAWHKGLDFAGKMGSDIIAVAAGVVTWADKRYGYGNLVQINHGNGYSTRYGHSSKILVKPGDVVKKGQVVAKMGSSGRSTGAHVHFEVLKAGKSVNPETYVNRASR